MSQDPDELARLAALRSYQVLDRPRPVVLDDLTKLAAGMFDTPISAVSLVDRDRQWFAGQVGLAEAETPLAVSFCRHVVPARAPLIVPDATRDSRFAAYPNVTGEPGIRFYAGAPVIDEEGHVLGAMCVVDTEAREISDRQVDNLVTFARQAAGHLSAVRGRLRVADLGDELARAAQREDELVATITHELRTPVAIIQGYLEILGDQDGLEQYRRLIDPIHRNGRRLVEMVDHILAGTRPPEAPIPAPVETVDLNTVVAAALSSCRSLITLRGDPVDVASYGPVLVRADLARLAHAVEQLLRNALAFTPADRPITVRVESAPRPAIEVRDGGTGIPEDELPLVFDRFHRGRHAREQAVPGVGLGLTIARNIVQAHRGELTVRNTADGVSARIRLPGAR
ncbi:putative GAF-sensor signal transduction histidine kinase [Actinoplanes missouriensis 431]|uniref:histidine kinase n=1 Tax=Actinoplanes missouriensis (strain ATCC 14538 / DSM 43046 / CBS 188.64 / JCM 3121 / NBRC 102363 / NCIMB 12654 / NRRL B-3342 / UNCC 431) TaxID=512565 RepID=I0H1V2_ACTM4|nr:GAF domain-containing sensor histidine kinase [Actinoplanes missouriensis]BAL86989.1 putative GAF-sensor signal transduction histidine kinase [Actinoplanes missouriensis 431]